MAISGETSKFSAPLLGLNHHHHMDEVGILYFDHADDDVITVNVGQYINDNTTGSDNMII